MFEWVGGFECEFVGICFASLAQLAGFTDEGCFCVYCVDERFAQLFMM